MDDLVAPCECASGASNRQALANPDQRANNHASSTTKAELRLARAFEKHFISGMTPGNNLSMMLDGDHHGMLIHIK